MMREKREIMLYCKLIRYNSLSTGIQGHPNNTGISTTSDVVYEGSTVSAQYTGPKTTTPPK
jgi:hypothetical protein